ncbi:hypothetical protein I4F81_003367 [Pyropia yezoensis]|uniref:Uncharacterized protein n=1 Tax=Pyropia yezoensis TaxID=2788 RepID=A0ACC3BSR4_PYRYE|nr:hypothetical protein I4F81_003367 [Neopyropia yezoensis]
MRGQAPVPTVVGLPVAPSSCADGGLDSGPVSPSPLPPPCPARPPTRAAVTVSAAAAAAAAAFAALNRDAPFLFVFSPASPLVLAPTPDGAVARGPLRRRQRALCPAIRRWAPRAPAAARGAGWRRSWPWSTVAVATTSTAGPPPRRPSGEGADRPLSSTAGPPGSPPPPPLTGPVVGVEAAVVTAPAAAVLGSSPVTSDDEGEGAGGGPGPIFVEPKPVAGPPVASQACVPPLEPLVDEPWSSADESSSDEVAAADAELPTAKRRSKLVQALVAIRQRWTRQRPSSGPLPSSASAPELSMPPDAPVAPPVTTSSVSAAGVLEAPTGAVMEPPQPPPPSPPPPVDPPVVAVSPQSPPPPPPTEWSNRRSAEAAASVPVDSPYHLRMVDGVTDRSKPLHPVLEVLQSRLAVGSKPGARADGYKVGLAIEGGGMRGVLSAGMAAALKYLGLQDAIDVVYGSSAGSIIGAYFVSGQVPLYGASIYYDSICSDRFISKRALLSSPYLLGRSGRAVTDAAGNKVRPVLYLDALLDEVIKETKPLDWDAFVKHSAKQPLKPVASSLTAMRSEILDGFSTLDELLDCLRASARVPGIAGDPVAINGAFYSDAMIFEPVPFRSALADGCTHVLVLRTKPETSRLPSRPGIYEALIAAPYFNRNPDSPCPAAARFVLDGKHIGIYKEVVEDLRRRRSGWVDPAAAAAGGSSGWVLDVVPAWDSKEVAQLETRPRIIYNGARNGFAAAYEALSPFATPSAEVYGTNRGRGGKGTAVGGPAGPPASGPPRRGRRAPTPPPPSATPPPSPGAAASSGIAGGQAVAATVAAAATPPAASAATAATPRLGSIRRKADAFGAPTERLRAGDVVARFVFRDDVLEAQLARTSSASAADAAVTPGVLAKLAARRRRRARGGCC